MSDPSSAGLLPHADRWSKITFAFGALGLLTLGSAVIGSALSHPDQELLVRPVQSFATLGLALMIIVSAVVYVGCRIVRWQRKIAARLDAIERRLPDDDGPGHLRLVGAPLDVPPDNVRAFELGRRVERDRRDGA